MKMSLGWYPKQCMACLIDKQLSNAMMHHPGWMKLIPEDMRIRVLAQCAIGTANGLCVWHRVLCKVVGSHIAGLLAVCEAQGCIVGHLHVHH